MLRPAPVGRTVDRMHPRRRRQLESSLESCLELTFGKTVDKKSLLLKFLFQQNFPEHCRYFPHLFNLILSSWILTLLYLYAHGLSGQCVHFKPKNTGLS